MFKNLLKKNLTTVIGVSLIYTIANILEALALAFVVPLILLVNSNSAAEYKGFLVGKSVRIMESIINLPPIKLNLQPAYAAGFVIVIVILLKSILTWLGRHLTSLVTSKIQNKVNRELYDCIIDSNVEFVRNQQIGRITNALCIDSIRLADGIFVAFQWISNMSLLMVYALFVITTSWKIALVVMLLGAIGMYPLKFIPELATRYGMRLSKSSDEVQQEVIQSIQSIKSIKGANAENFFKSRFQQASICFSTDWRWTAFYSNSVPIYSQPIAIILLVVIIILSGKFNIEPGEQIFFMLAFLRFLPTLQNTISLKSDVNRNLYSIKKISDVLEDAKNHAECSSGDYTIANLDSICLNNVTYKHPKSTASVQKINFSISPELPTAICGESGSGKTTLLDLILRFNSLQGGVIEVNGLDLRKIKLEEWRSTVAYLPQESFIFNDSIRNNILIGKTKVTKSNFEQALQISDAESVISKIPEGLEHQISDQGNRLSGGEKQRIALARILIKNARLIVLDEATNALDEKTEVKIMTNLIEYTSKNKILLIVVTHRQSVANMFPNRFVLKQ